MAQRTIYLPDDLDAAVKATGINASQVCQAALRHEVDLATARTLAAGVVAADGTPPSATRRAGAVEQPTDRGQPPVVVGAQTDPAHPGRPLPPASEPLEVDCTATGVPAWPGGYRLRHLGPLRHLGGYAKVCQACGRAVQ